MTYRIPNHRACERLREQAPRNERSARGFA
jgi:hypothetical protein